MAAPEGYKSLGTVGIAYKGEYLEGTTYKYLNCVYYEGSTYLALQEVTGETPNNDGVKWRYLAQGVVGPAAGFGEITVTVDETTGTPNATVTPSGPDTAKELKFSFSGLKGEKGETGGIGPQGQTGPQGDEGPQGKQGEQGVSITGAHIGENGHLMIELSEGGDVDAGEIPLNKEGIVEALGYTPAEQPKQITQTLLMNSWTGTQTPYSYTIEIPGLTVKQFAYVTADFSGKELTEIPDLIDAFANACIRAPKEQQVDNKIILQAANKPTTDLPIVIIIGGELING